MYQGNIIAFCGRICDECLAYISKKTDDDTLRKRAAQEWSSGRFSFKLEDINCDGCTKKGDLFAYCMQCKVRKCGLEKKVENCAYCTEYPCVKLKKVWKFLLFPHAQEVLDEIRKALQPVDGQEIQE